MMRQVCSPRIVRSVFVSFAVVLLGSITVLAHNPQNSDLADNPSITAQLQSGQGKPVQLDGEMEIVHQDFPDGHGRFVFTLKQTDGTRVPMKFAKHPPTHLLTGDHVRVNGQMLNGNLLLYSGSNAKQTGGGGSGGGSMTPSIPVPNTFGTQSVLVMLVNFQDDASQPYTVADAQSMFFGPVNNFILEGSYGQTSLTGNVVGWYTIPDSVTACNIYQIATDSQNAAVAAGVNLSNYSRYVYAFPFNSACGFAGASNVGGNPSQSWINTAPLDLHTIDHELGHALGLWHSHLLYCGASATIGSNCSIGEYGDIVDTMGPYGPWSPHYNAFQKERLGWLNYASSPSIQTVTASGTYNINPYELGGAGPKALKILMSTDPTTGAKTWYYLEFRQAVGFDAFLTDGTCEQCYTQNETTGVLFHTGTDSDGNSSDLLDMTPATQTFAWWFDPSLVVGQSFADATAGVTFTPTAVSSSGATVQITMNGSSCAAANPTVSISPSQSQAVTAGSPVAFAVTVTDNDSSGCSGATFNLADALQPGWTGGWSAASLSLSPGKSNSATLTVTSPAGTASGSYNVSTSAVKASQSSSNGSAVGTYVISTATVPSVSLWTDQSSYLPGQMVAIRVSLLFGTSPDVGARVTVTVTSPSGKKTTLSGTTDSNGMSSLSYRLGRNAPPGTYQVQYGTAVPGAAPTAGASTSFTVQ